MSEAKNEASELMPLLGVNGTKRADLLSLPVRKWDDTEKHYDSLLVLSDGRKHDSGWGIITIIGCVDQKAVEIAVDCADDISWHFSQEPRMDCALPSRAMHFWCRAKGKYRVGCAISSVDVYLDA